MATRKGSVSAAHRAGTANSIHTSKNVEQRDASFIKILQEPARIISPDNFSMRTGPFMPTASAGHSPPLFCSPQSVGAVQINLRFMFSLSPSHTKFAHTPVQGVWRPETRFNGTFSAPWRESDPHFFRLTWMYRAQKPAIQGGSVSRA